MQSSQADSRKVKKLRAKQKVYYAFVDLEKAYDRIPREVVKWALRKACVEEWLVSNVMTMYKGAMTAVKTEDGLTDWFKILVVSITDQYLAHCCLSL